LHNDASVEEDHNNDKDIQIRRPETNTTNNNDDQQQDAALPKITLDTDQVGKVRKEKEMSGNEVEKEKSV
jgi:hypothetical protein